MTEFEKTQWSGKETADWFIKEADMRVVDRKRLIETLKSFYKHFLGVKKNNKVLDLGCGDGFITSELLKIDGSISATLIDGSEHMIEKAKERLSDAGFKDVRFVEVSFQDLFRKNHVEINLNLFNFDLVFSSLAIHHLTMDEKRSLFEFVYRHLEDGGCFVNIDVLLSPTEDLEVWYLDLWREWMVNNMPSLNQKNGCEYTIEKYMELNHHKTLSTLNDQMNALKNIGFKDVDCYYKNGIFAMYGGRK